MLGHWYNFAGIIFQEVSITCFSNYVIVIVLVYSKIDQGTPANEPFSVLILFFLIY